MAIFEAVRMSLYGDAVVVSVFADDADGRPTSMDMTNTTPDLYGLVLTNNNGNTITVEIPNGFSTQSIPNNIRNRIDMRDPDLFVISPSLRDWMVTLSRV